MSPSAALQAAPHRNCTPRARSRNTRAMRARASKRERERGWGGGTHALHRGEDERGAIERGRGVKEEGALSRELFFFYSSRSCRRITEQLIEQTGRQTGGQTDR